MEKQELLPHLFRTEYSKIVAVLCKYFGLDHIEMAEDIASDTFLSAFEIWTYKGIPEHPTAWLYTVAKNKAKNQLRRSSVFNKKIKKELIHSSIIIEETEPDLSDQNILDSQLQMLFAVCHPSIPAVSQVGLALRLLCGFGIEEIANAFLTGKETINKRLLRAKEKLRLEKVHIVFPSESEISPRLNNVLRTLYLLFNEGYFSESRNPVLRQDLCEEAMRLTLMLLKYEPTNQPESNALYALMSFHASRFAARTNDRGDMILYEDQDESLWQTDLIARGAEFLHFASKGNRLSKYHLEAGIAYWHTVKEMEEKWENILLLFDQLLQIEYSPIAALNRTYALSKVRGKSVAIEEAEKLKLTNNPFYFTLLGELYSGSDNQKAKLNFLIAKNLTKTISGKQIIQKKIEPL